MPIKQIIIKNTNKVCGKRSAPLSQELVDEEFVLVCVAVTQSASSPYHFATHYNRVESKDDYAVPVASVTPFAQYVAFRATAMFICDVTPAHSAPMCVCVNKYVITTIRVEKM